MNNTLDYYNKNAKLYFDQTIEAELNENYEKFLSKISDKSYILDLGCGSGRDSKYFIQKGHRVKAIDGSLEMCKLASKYINQDVECMKFEELIEENVYDAIWACSSILHVEKESLPNILNKTIKAVKSKGIIYMSFKKGEGHEIKDNKYYNYLTRQELEKIVKEVDQDIGIIDYFETIGSTKRSETVIWANFILQKMY